MNGRWHVDRSGLLFAVGAPAGGLLIVVACTALTAFGPEVLTGNWAGRALMGLLGFAGYGLVLFTQLRYFNFLVFFGAFFALFIGLHGIDKAVEEWVFHQRGEIVTCAVRDIDRREVTSTDSEGDTTTYVYFDYRLACADPGVQKITTDSQVAERGDRIEVFHDPAGRLAPRLAASVGDPRSSLEFGAALFGTGIVLRLLSELGVPPFRSWDGTDLPWRNLTRRWTRFRRRRREPTRY